MDNCMNEKRLQIAKNSIIKLAEQEGVSVEYVRIQLEEAIQNGLDSEDEKKKAFWESIPRERDVPTPEEVVLYISEQVKRRRGH
jgi:EAL domain-containing protein (putative c-di-GMP-specific phosphodiesterase class I)